MATLEQGYFTLLTMACMGCPKSVSISPLVVGGGAVVGPRMMSRHEDPSVQALNQI